MRPEVSSFRSADVGSPPGGSATFASTRWTLKGLFYPILENESERAGNVHANTNLPEGAFLASAAINHQNQSML